MARIERFFTREFMEDNDYPYELMDKTFIEEHRWYTVWSGVFEYDGAHYQVTYLEPATEMQEEDSWNGEERIPATKVALLPVVRQEWCPVDE